MGRVDRRQFIRGTTAATLIGLAGCAGDGDGDGDGTDGTGDGTGDGNGDGGTTDGGDGFTGTAKIAYVGALSGPFASNGQGVRDGEALAVEHINNGDRFDFEIEHFEADDEASPENAVNEARRLVNQEDVDVFVAGEATSVALAVSEFCASQDVLHIAPVTASRDITGSAYQDTTFHTNDNLDELAAAGVEAQSQEISPSRIAAVMPDYAFGRKAWDAIQHFMEETFSGYEIVEEVFPGFGKGDYQNEIQSVMSAEPDTVWSALWAGDLQSFIQQGNQFGMFEEVPNFHSIGGVDMVAARTLGPDEMPDAMISGPLYYPLYPDNERQTRFLNDFRDEYDRVPLEANGCGYRGMMTAAEAIDVAGSTETNALIDALEGHEFDTVEGTVQIRADDHKLIDPNWYVGRVDLAEEIPDFMGLNPIWPIESDPGVSTNTEEYGA